MQKIAFELAVNSLSIGQIGTTILRELYERELSGSNELDIYFFPIGNIDLSSQSPDENFQKWLQTKMVKGLQHYHKSIPIFKCWHLNSSLQSYSSTKQTLLSFYELDSPTNVETNIGKNNNLVFSSQFTCDVFKIFGVNSTYLPLPFDNKNFHRKDRVYHKDGRIVFNFCGKLERRKNHVKGIQSWIRKFGNNPKFALQCAIFNPFLGNNPQEIANNNQAMIQQIVGNNKPFNVNFYPTFKENSLYNDFLNSGDIILGVSSGEGWDLPASQSVSIGKHSVILDAHAYKGWATNENSVLIPPSGKEEIYDNVFFHKGSMFNQGSGFSWDADEFLNGCELAIKKVEKDRINHEGLKLQQQFTIKDFVDNIIRLTL